LSTLNASDLAMPESLLKLLTVETESRAGRTNNGADLENLGGNLGAAFDHLSAAKTVAGLVLDQMLDAETANRLIAFADRQQNALTLPELIETANKAIWVSGGEGMNKSIQRGTQRVYLDALMTLGADNASTSDVKAVVMMEMAAIKTQLAGMKDSDPVTEAHLRQLERDATRYLNNPQAPRRSTPPPPTMAPI
jgi:Met-zincin